MKSRSTKPVSLEGPNGASQAAWQSDDLSWSFGPSRDRVVAWAESPATAPPLPDARNLNRDSTLNPQKIDSPARESPTIARREFGQRSLQALGVWEGEVEKVEGDEFVCRLVPMIGDASNRANLEVTRFSFDDLANEADRDLIAPGAIFYWTVGRQRNAAGTVSNISLVRFRRLPPPSAARASSSMEEAARLLSVLACDDDVDASGS